MARVAREIDYSTRAAAYFAHTDRDLTLLPAEHAGGTVTPVDRLRALLAFYALFYAHLIVFDSGVIYNPLLREIFCGRDWAHHRYAELLSDGTLVAARRDVAPTFSDLERHLRTTGTYQPLDARVAIEFAEFLDERGMPDIVSSQTQVYRTYSEAIELVLTHSGRMQRLGLGDVAPRALEYADSRRGAFNGLIRRSFFYEYADRLAADGQPAAATTLRELASAISSHTYATRLNLGPAFPERYERVTDAVYELPPRQEQFALRPVHEIALDWLPLEINVLRLLTYEEISDIRRSKAFATYTDALRAAQQEGDAATAGVRIEKAVSDYMVALQEPLSLVVAGKYDRVRTLDKRLRISTYGSGAGTVTTTVVGTVLGGLPGALLGLIWAPITFAARKLLEHQRDAETASARGMLLLNRGDLRGSDDGPR